jgi:dihydrofolate reductase
MNTDRSVTLVEVPMGMLRVFESISVDGYFADPQGDMRWAHTGGDDPEFGVWVAHNASSGGTLLFGRKTYDMMAAFWPTPLAAAQMPEVAKGMNAARKYLASRTLQPTWSNTTLLTGELVSAVRALKDGTDTQITLLGSGSVAAQLGAAGLVDEYQFVIVPVALGAGRTVFSAGRALTLKSQRAFRNGNVVVTYGA